MEYGMRLLGLGMVLMVLISGTIWAEESQSQLQFGSLRANLPQEWFSLSRLIGRLRVMEDQPTLMLTKNQAEALLPVLEEVQDSELLSQWRAVIDSFMDADDEMKETIEHLRQETNDTVSKIRKVLTKKQLAFLDQNVQPGGGFGQGGGQPGSGGQRRGQLSGTSTESNSDTQLKEVITILKLKVK